MVAIKALIQGLQRVSVRQVGMLYILVLSIALTSFSATAQLSDANTPKILTDANKLVVLSPSQARHFAITYLTENNLLSRESRDRKDMASEPQQVRNAIYAHQVLAISEYLLRNPRQSKLEIDTAIELAQQRNTQPHLIDSLLIKARLQLEMNTSKEVVQDTLKQAQERYSQWKSSLPAGALESDHLAFKSQYLRQSAELYSMMNNSTSSDELFEQLNQLLEQSPNEMQSILFGLSYGEHLHRHKRYNESTKELIEAYWRAVEFDQAEFLARVNYQLGKLYADRGTYELSEAHFEQSASFYGAYETSPYYAGVINRLADVYFVQGKYNLALVQYFNVLEHQISQRNLESIINIRLRLARTYINLFNYALAEQYLERAKELLIFSNTGNGIFEANIIEATLYNLQQQPEKAIQVLARQFEQERGSYSIEHQIEAAQVLTTAYDETGQAEKALAALQLHNQLVNAQIMEKSALAKLTLLRQIESYEKAIHYKSQVLELESAQTDQDKFRKIALGLSFGILIFILFYIQKSIAYHSVKDKLELLSEELYTHPRSKLQNLRMINASLAPSLAKSSASFEQWQLGELINEPLSDRLRFALLDVSIIRNVYSDKGYQVGLKIEKAFGQHLRDQLQEGERLYHFSDGIFLFIQSKSEASPSVEALFERFVGWLESFTRHSTHEPMLRVSFVDYPFLPRALTAIDDKELIDILLLSNNIAKQIQQQQPGEHWVHLQAITHAPAASFAGDNIRKSCVQAIAQGLIKVHSSCTSEDIIKSISYD
ncbi:hypothetical protein ST37_11545 [Vibrio sp. qd031]|uniref:tetratricopeptide repeat protein n=1 Tax=Vibrio sp. qd031 TaxID=1603038 RepID=UPI000A102005|nr:hypothetical protein [Vibrio sp. qd031]ORT50487.1 hypothetical protein ST37_11545 [Vibrio sp. qd031]